MASAYSGAFTVKANEVNTLDLTLLYIQSDPKTDLSFIGYTPDTGDATDYAPITGIYHEATEIKVASGGSGGSNYTLGDRLLVNASSTPGDLNPVGIVTKVTGGTIEKVSIENPGRFNTAPSLVVGGFPSSYVTGDTGGIGATFDITVKDGAVNKIPANVPWLSYIGGRASPVPVPVPGSNSLVFNVKTDNIGPLLAAGGSTGSGDFELKRAELRIAAIGSSGFSPVRKVIDSPTLGTDYSTVASPTLPTLPSVTAIYTLNPATDFPGADEKGYGTLYYSLGYKAFGLDKGSTWSIRSGRDLSELDEGALSTGAAILVRIGNPGKFTSKVEVQINAP
jgi:hypothetical protein